MDPMYPNNNDYEDGDNDAENRGRRASAEEWTDTAVRACACVAGCLVTIAIPVYDFSSWLWNRRDCCCPGTGQRVPSSVPRARRQWLRERGRGADHEVERLMQEIEDDEDADDTISTSTFTGHAYTSIDADGGRRFESSLHPFEAVSDPDLIP